jgi:hypothetical protein
LFREALLEMHHRTLRRWLARRSVPLLHVGSSVAVPLVAFRVAFPELWASLKAVHELRQAAACPVCGERTRSRSPETIILQVP